MITDIFILEHYDSDSDFCIIIISTTITSLIIINNISFLFMYIILTKFCLKIYLQNMGIRLEEWRVRRDIEEWMRHRQLPLDL